MGLLRALGFHGKVRVSGRWGRVEVVWNFASSPEAVEKLRDQNSRWMEGPAGEGVG